MAIEESIGDELLIYREDEGPKVLLLNPVSAFVYKRQEDVRESDLMKRFQTSPEQARDLLDAARSELQEHGLLTTPHKTTRRALLAASLAPLVSSVILPQPAAAASGCLSGCQPLSLSAFASQCTSAPCSGANASSAGLTNQDCASCQVQCEQRCNQTIFDDKLLSWTVLNAANNPVSSGGVRCQCCCRP